MSKNWIRGKGHRVIREGGVIKVHVPAVLLSSVSSLYTGLRRCDGMEGCLHSPGPGTRLLSISAHTDATENFYSIFRMWPSAACAWVVPCGAP